MQYKSSVRLWWKNKAAAIFKSGRFNSIDSAVIISSVSEVIGLQDFTVSGAGAVDLGLIPSRIKPTTLTLVFTASLLDAQH